MQKYAKTGCVLLLSITLCGCWQSNSSLQTTPVTPVPDAGVVNITSTPNPVGDIYMYGAGGPDDITGNPNSFVITATAALSGNDVPDQTITATGNEPGVVITSNPSPCTLSAVGGASSCAFTVTAAWNTNNPVGATTPYTITLSNSGTAALSTPTVNYSLITPSVYLPQTGANETPVTTGLAWPSQRFTALAGNCDLQDNLTGLIWLKQPDSTLYNWDSTGQDSASAQYYITHTLNAGSGSCGSTNWRLPTQNELLSLLNYSQPNPGSWLMQQGFSNVQSNAYWSSTEAATSLGNAWVVRMIDGSVNFEPEVNSFHYVWAVRNGQ